MSFLTDHRTALGRNEAKHGLLLTIIDTGNFSLWPIGDPGQCAVTAVHGLFLGDLTDPQCQRLSEITATADIFCAIGPDDTAPSFAGHAQNLGCNFVEIEKQIIWAIQRDPIYPRCAGQARMIRSDDLELMLEWIPAFQAESNPHDRVPPREIIEHRIRQGDITLWEDQGRVVSMAGITRRLTYSAAITGVYTPPEHRGHGYAAAVTASCVERVYAEGHAIVSLYTNAAYPASNRCYEKVGFTKVCRSSYWKKR